MVGIFDKLIETFLIIYNAFPLLILL